MSGKRVFTINCGSTSTKIGLFEGETCLFSESLRIDVAQYTGSLHIADQLEERTQAVRAFLQKNGVDMTGVDMIAARGGPLPPCEGGAYAVNQLMADVLKYAPGSEHASALSAVIAYELSREFGKPAIIYDGVMSDEFSELAHITGLPQWRRSGGGHVLNSRAMAHRAAAELGIRYEEGRFVVAHMGGGITVSAHENGRMVDTEYNVMSPERVGGLQTLELIKYCYSGEYSQKELTKFFLGAGGFVAYLGTSDAREVARRAQEGDEQCMLLYRAMAYQICKAVASMTAVLSCDVDAIILTGGIAWNDLLIELIRERVSKLGKILVYPGELELEALAQGACRVLAGEEQAKEFTAVPAEYASAEDFYKKKAAQMRCPCGQREGRHSGSQTHPAHRDLLSEPGRVLQDARRDFRRP